jgi:hypothetical protein
LAFATGTSGDAIFASLQTQGADSGLLQIEEKSVE